MSAVDTTPDQWEDLTDWDDYLPNGARRCHAHAKSGDRCKRPALKGARVCTSHGAGAPQVKASARRRMLELLDPAINELERVMRHGEKDADRLRAVENILDRAGMPRKTELDVDGASEDLLERIMALRGRVASGELTTDQIRSAAESGGGPRIIEADVEVLDIEPEE